MVKQVDLKYGMIFGFVGLIITLVVIYLTTGTLDLGFAAVVVAGFFGGGFLGSVMKRLYKEGEEKKANLIFLAIVLIVGTPLIAEYTHDFLTGNWKIWKFIPIFAFAYLISYGAFRVMKPEEVKMMPPLRPNPYGLRIPAKR